MKVPTFTVVLEVVSGGTTVGSTEDVIGADDALDAERIAIERCKAVRPDRSFRPLVTTAHVTGPAETS